jgi:DNA-binding NarL/FixJ family response regulator
VRVLVADDQQAFRRAAAAVIELTEGFALAGLATDGSAAVLIADETPVDLVLMDVNMPGIGGVAAADELADRHPEVIVTLVSTYSTADLPGDVVASGRPYLRKEHLSPEALVELWRRHRPTT